MSWANGHDRCKSCSTNVHNHKARGLCGSCYHAAAEKRHKSHVTRRIGSQLPAPITKEDLEQKYKSGLICTDGCLAKPVGPVKFRVTIGQKEPELLERVTSRASQPDYIVARCYQFNVLRLPVALAKSTRAALSWKRASTRFCLARVTAVNALVSSKWLDAVMMV